MVHKQVRGIAPAPFLIISLLGLFLLALIVFYPPTVIENFGWRKPLVGSILEIECFLGFLATIYPKRCSRVFGTKNKKQARLMHNLNKTMVSIRGHHPDCGNYSAHVFHIGGKYFCAGCTGLVLGAIMTSGWNDSVLLWKFILPIKLFGLFIWVCWNFFGFASISHI